uniref:Uncharacterized protein n=1 Tax=Oryza glumipatula TaxID=40148 RepID=A0A0E0BT86_9ORYZ
MNSTILDVFKSRNINGEFSGTVIHFYSFSYEGKDDTWYKGEIFPVTSLKTPLEKGKGIRVSIWTFPAEKEKELKEMILDLLPLESTALLKPSFAAYNSHIDRAILCCTPCTSNMTSWIAKQVQIPSDSYLQEDSKNMIRSILNLSKVMWDLGYACDGLDDPQSFIMMDSNVKLLPFGIRKRQNSDSEMMHRIKFSNLLENHLSQRWNDIEVNEFIKLMRNPSASLEHLLNHPLLLPPEIRMSSYLNLWIENLTPDQHNLYNSITSYGKWTSTIKSSQEVHSILTYKEKSSNRTKAPFDMVDKELKKCFPGLLCKIYAMTLDPLWNK